MRVSDACLSLLKQFEGCKLRGYLDTVGIPTIGYGHTSTTVRVGDTITQEQAEGYLHNDVERFSHGINDAVTSPLTQGQFDALVSFAYNVGVERFRHSTMLSLINAGNLSSAAEEFTKWTNAGGKRLNGLVKRRNAERELFLGV